MNHDQRAVLPPYLRKPNLRAHEVVTYLEEMHGIPVSVKTLSKWRSLGAGPAFHKAGITPIYPIGELDKWAIKRLGALRNTGSAR